MEAEPVGSTGETRGAWWLRQQRATATTSARWEREGARGVGEGTRDSERAWGVRGDAGEIQGDRDVGR